MKPSALAILTLLVISSASCAEPQQNSPPATTLEREAIHDWIRTRINAVMDEHDIPALSVGIVQEGHVTFLEGFGVMTRGTNLKVDDRSIYQIASQSKMLTGIIANNLIEEGKLDLETRLTSYLPLGISAEARQRLKNVTVKQVLQHTAGIPGDACSLYRERSNGDFWIRGYSEDELIADINSMVLEFAPGSKWSYSNSGYAIAGYVCEQASGKSYAALLREYVTDPYAMGSTGVTVDEQQQRRVATPYRTDDRRVETKEFIMGKATPASSIYSSTRDLSNLAARQIQAYRLHESKGISGPLIVTENAASTGGDDNSRYGYGLFEKEDDYGTRYFHGGDADGFASGYALSPQENVGLVLLTSSGGRWFGRLETEIFSKLTNRPYEKPKESIARSVFDVTMEHGIAAGLERFDKIKDSDLYYLREDEMNRVG